MKRKILLAVSCVAWALPLLSFLIIYAIIKFSVSDKIAELFSSSYEAYSIFYAMFLAVAFIYVVQIVVYIVHVIRQKYWNDIGKKYFWICAILAFGIFMIPVYWVKYIYKNESN